MAYWNKNYCVGYRYIFSPDEMDELGTDKPSGKVVSVNKYQMVLSLGKEWSWSDFWWKEKLVTIDFELTLEDQKRAKDFMSFPTSWLSRSSRRDNDDDHRRSYDTGISSYSDSWTPSWGGSSDDSSSNNSSFSFGGGDFGGGGSEGSYDSGSSDSGNSDSGGDSGGGDGGSSD